MRKLIVCMIFGAAMMISACGASSAPTVQQAATAVNAPEAGTAEALAGTAVNAPEASTAVALASTAVNAPEAGTAVALAGTAVNAPEAATAEALTNEAVTAAADDVTIKQGEALVLDASKSVGDIKDYKWTIMQAPTGAASVVGQVIKEGSSGNVSLNPDDYTKYFPTAGAYTIRLTVMDTKGTTSNDDFTVTMP
jgi:hypothetical protein